VAFSPTGNNLAAVYDKGEHWEVLVFPPSLESWIRLAERVANRNLSRTEWKQYFPDMSYQPTFKDLPVRP
jgi:hypothetical protein